MRTAGELSGLAVVSEAAGERLGRIQDIVFQTAGGTITGFLVRTGGLLAKPQLLPRLLVRRLGQDAVLVEQGAVLEPVHAEPAPEGSPNQGSISGHALDGRPVLDASGTVIGHVADVLVDEAQMKVEALLLSGTLLGNLLHGKPRLPLSQVRTLGQDSVVASREYDIQAAKRYPAR